MKKWTKNKVLANAKKYFDRTEWIRNSQNSYLASKRLNIFYEATAHMGRKRRPPGYWIEERILEEAKKYQNRTVGAGQVVD